MAGTDDSKQRGRAFAAALTAWAAMLGASLANFLHYQGYPLARCEVAVVAIILLALAAAMAALHSAAGRGARALAIGLLVVLAVDINADRMWLALLLGLAAAGFAWKRGGETLKFLTLLFAVILATALAGLGGRADGVETKGRRGAANPAQPLVVHVILDEQAGPVGLSAADAAWLEGRYAAMGFSLYPEAYSRHYNTKNSLAELVGGRPGGGGMAQALAVKGYGARFVTQTDHYDLCADLKPARCTTYSASSLKPLAGQALSAADKAQVLAYHFAGLSTIARKIANSYDKIARRAGWATVELRSVRKVPQVNAVAMVPAAEAELKAARPGEYHLIHLLLPHAPFAFDERCRLLPTRDWRTERGDAPLAERDAAYRRQMGCAAEMIDRLTAAAGKEAVVIVHGDHGSRIVAYEPWGKTAAKASEADFKRGFATLIAVRLPGQAARTLAGPAVLTDVLPALARSGFTDLPAPGGERPWVNIDYRGWTPVKQRRLADWKLPQSGARAPAEQQKP